jgi:membrane protein YdbS with pleckstrin-like domain
MRQPLCSSHEIVNSYLYKVFDVRHGEEMSEELQKSVQEGKASKKMINIWMWRWSLGAFIASFGIVFALMMMFAVEFDETTGEIVNFSIWPFVFFLLIISLISLAIGLVIARGWATLYWRKYSFEFHDDRVVVTRGVIGKRVTNIPYERIQNVNVWKGILERIYGLSTIMIETAGGTQLQMGNYGSFSFSEGTIQGVKDPQPMVDYLIRRAKGRDGLGSIGKGNTELTNESKISLLEERLLKGQISEETYKELKSKYERK